MSEKPLMLSVSGLRGWIGQSLTPDVVAKYAATVGCHFKRTSKKQNPKVVVGRDSRPSGQMVEQAAIAGLISVGCQVVKLGITSTPSVAIMVKHLHADGGMVITASHNPTPWNGLKTLSCEGLAPPADQANQIIEQFQTGSIDYVDVDGLQKVKQNDQANQIHVDRVLDNIDVALIQKAKPKVVLDSVHGAGGPEAKLLLDALGVELVHLYAEPTGQFPHNPEPLPANLTGLCDAVRAHGGDIGFAQDPDADRLAIVDEKGRYIGEEYTLLLGAMQVFNRHTDGPKIAAANLSSSRMIDDLADQHGGKVYRSPVGEANVVSVMKQHDAIVGGEGGGGIIWPKVGYVRDSLVGMALTLELLAQQKQSLSTLIDTLPKYAIVKDKLPIENGMTQQAIERLQVYFSDDKIDLQDGIRIDFEDSWVHVRASNTEPIMRVIAEAADEKQAKDIVQRTRQAIGV